MSTPAEKIKYLNETKIAIKEAIVAKGVEIAEDATFRSFADSIAEIDTALPQQEKSLAITKNGSYEATPDEGYVLSKVTAVVAIDIPEPEEPVIESLEIVENGTYTAPAGVDGYSPIIVNVPTGGGGDIEGLPEEIVLSGNCQFMFQNGMWDWAVECFGDRMSTKDMYSSQYMFKYSNLTKIPFDLNYRTNGTASCEETFAYMYNLTEIPKINNCKPANSMNNFFTSCYRLRNLPEDLEDCFDWSYLDNSTSAWSDYRTSTFNRCYSLRSIPAGFLNHYNRSLNSTYNSLYYNLFYECYALDEVVGLPVEIWNSAKTSNCFQYTFNNNHRLKNLTFEVQEDGSPYVANWQSQIIDLTYCVGYTEGANFTKHVLDYNSGITADKKVPSYGAAEYEALKNDPDWFAEPATYSRYNHDSAVATINSLPDTSAYLATAGGTNTIKFKGAAGGSTDGGAINTLTAEEIAVATAKGWTVTLS